MEKVNFVAVGAQSVDTAITYRVVLIVVAVVDVGVAVVVAVIVVLVVVAVVVAVRIRVPLTCSNLLIVLLTRHGVCVLWSLDLPMSCCAAWETYVWSFYVIFFDILCVRNGAYGTLDASRIGQQIVAALTKVQRAFINLCAFRLP